ADRNRSHWSTSKTPSYTKSVSWQHHRRKIIIKTVMLPNICPFIASRNLRRHNSLNERDANE
ncbi:hypothetical protein ACPXBM_21525, partial [Escherichia coli]|uniref:hypothetical protein n=1 Tax=Escherichia coli TaxID=562 RepID=UPI003CE563A5